MTARNPPMARGSGRSAYPQGRRPAVPYTTRAPGRVCRVLGPVRLLDDGRTVNPTQRLTGESGGLSHPLRLLTRRSRRAEEEGHRADSRLLLGSPNARGLAARRDAGIPKSQSAAGAGL